jgi:diguanylate cyclase (GGDEF)-like protein
MNITGWYLVTYVKRNTILKDLHRMQLIMTIIALIGASILIMLTRFSARQMSLINKKSKMDKLTKVLNREGFEEQVMAMLHEASGHGALLILDMDNFKLINDNLGHPVGDEVLVKFARLLEDFFNRKRDVVARIGGDEFVVFMGRNVDHQNMDVLLKSFMDKMHETFDKEYADFKLTSSIGGTFVEPGLSYSTLYQRADHNLYIAKKMGKNDYQI